MSKHTEQIAKGLKQLLSKQEFYDFYMKEWSDQLLGNFAPGGKKEAENNRIVELKLERFAEQILKVK